MALRTAIDRVAAASLQISAYARKQHPGAVRVSSRAGAGTVRMQVPLDVPRAATNRKEPDRGEQSQFGKVPIERLADIAPGCRISRARVVDAGRIVTASGIASGMEMGFYLLRRAGDSAQSVQEVARVMEYKAAYDLYAGDVEQAV